MDKLKAYRSKRDFEKTREPAGESTGDAAAGRLFVIHKHDAQRLHFDLRLEQDGVLRSWALPKGPSLEPGEKRLAVEVEDHPLEYADFEGVIPKDAYGGGTVMVWDRGQWAGSDGGKSKSRDPEDRIDFVLDGEKLKGAWTLARMAGKSNEKKKNWLLIKRRDSGGGRSPPAERDNESVLSGRTMERIANDRDRVWTQEGEKTTPALPDPAALDGAKKGKLPTTPRPQLATLVQAAPEGDGWLHEIKLDGYRLLARLENGRAQLFTRNGKDWTARFARLAKALARLPVDRALLDGEVVALGADGVSSFKRLQEALSAGHTEDVVYQVFDLLHLEQHDLMPAPLLDRKQALAQLLQSTGFTANDTVRYSDHLTGQGPAFFEQACRLGLEGIICKRADGAYRPGRNKQWLKVKCAHDDEFVVVGFSDPSGGRSGFGALLLGAHDDDGKLRYTGRVGTGFSDRQLVALHDVLRQIEQDASPFDDPVPDTRDVHWVRPQIVAEVAFTQRTREGRLRHPSFRGLREDRDAQDIRLPGETPASKPTGTKTKRRGQAGPARVAGVRLTHPQRVLYPEHGITKLDLARYYEQIQDWILPNLADRPLSLLRCPDGRDKECFFQKHPRAAIPNSVPRIIITEKNGPRDCVYVRSAPDLVALVQAGVLELHPWGSRIDNVERPDRIIFDLDPAPGVAWAEILRVARGLRDRLERLGLASFVRTTGGKGLHLVVPIARRTSWDDAKAFARAVSRQHARAEPKRLTTNMSKDKRRGRIFIDYLRNGRGATAIASYSVRARQGAPIAVPVRWDELSSALRSDRYDIQNLHRRLSALSEDPWAGFAEARRQVTRRMRQNVGLE